MTSATVNERILCVDDEPHVLDAFKRQLRSDFDLTVISSPERAIEQIKSGERFAVIVSDMRMPRVNGTTLLKIVREIAPDTVRVMLTGNSDQETAASAVNEGKIFRFVNKPCSTSELAQVLREAIDYHHMLRAEKDLLQNTLAGSVRALTDILSLCDPIAFGSGAKMRQPAKEVATAVNYQSIWEIELAAMLSEIGWISVPSDVKQRFRSGAELGAAETTLIEGLPHFGSSVIGAIPRLSGVAKIILYSGKRFDGGGFPKDGVKGEQIPLGSRILAIARAMTQREGSGMGRQAALRDLQGDSGLCDSALLTQLIAHYERSAPEVCEIQRYEIGPRDLCVGHRLMENLECADGRLLLTAGTYISDLLRTSIINHAENVGLRGSIVVDARIPVRSRRREEVH